MKAITSLGVGNYERVTYVWENRSYQTELFPEALGVWLQKDIAEMLVLLTPEARHDKHWERLKARLAGKVEVVPQDIPSGRSNEELWQIFDVLAKNLSTGDEIVFDITHAFRSIPILALIAVVFLRTAQSVQLKHLLYGAYEARDKKTNRAPVFDLTLFLVLLDWITATDKFVKTGDARELAELLRSTHRLQWQSATDKDHDLPHHLQSIGTLLENLSQALTTTRPHEVAEQATALTNRLDQAAAEFERWAKPFSILLQQIQAAYEPFTPDTLAAQRRLVRWYVERGYIVQAVTLAREWLVSWACSQLGKDHLTERDGVETAINEEAIYRRGETVDKPSAMLLALRALPKADVIVQAWSAVSDLRNDVAHCGMRSQPRSARSIVREAVKLADQLDTLVLSDETGQ